MWPAMSRALNTMLQAQRCYLREKQLLFIRSTNLNHRYISVSSFSFPRSDHPQLCQRCIRRNATPTPLPFQWQLTIQSIRYFATIRRRQKFNQQIVHPQAQVQKVKKGFGRQVEAYDHGEKDLDTYLTKATLSPWVPSSDATARKIMDLAEMGPNDVHVDLGSGDGRLNFQAIDLGVKYSLGIDNDARIVELARERVTKRHPQPDNLEFIVADLLQPGQEAIWEKIRSATIITMYFAEEGLQLIKPLLEEKLTGCKCKIVTVGYEMPDWNVVSSDNVLGTKINLYEWGFSRYAEDNNIEIPELTKRPSYLLPLTDKQQAELEEIMKDKEALKGVNMIEKVGKYTIRGFSNDWEDDKEAKRFDEDWKKVMERIEDYDEEVDEGEQITKIEEKVETNVEANDFVTEAAVKVEVTRPSNLRRR